MSEFDNFTYYGQYKQDKFLNKYFLKGKKDGIFVDIGAYDGITHNNTYFFEKELNWKGICCEPLPNMFNKLMENRKSSSNILCAIDEINGTTEFIKNIGSTEILSGIKKYYNELQQKRRDYELVINGGFYDTINTKTHRLDTIFNQLNINKVDYLSVDVEGGEFAVFKSIDFDKVHIDLISFGLSFLEIDNDIQDYLKEKGYIYISQIGEDVFMIKNNSEYIPENTTFQAEL